MDSQTHVFLASWICPVDQPPIKNGAVAVRGSKIVSFGNAERVQASLPEQSQIVDLGLGAIIPGLINAHTHLEFSNLGAPLGQKGISFTDWIRLIVSQRDNQRKFSSSESIQAGLQESFQAGVWAIGEIATQPFCIDDYQLDSARHAVLIFMEQLGRGPLVCEEKRIELLSLFSLHSDAILFGASPHAPYSVGPDLLVQIIEQSVERSRPVAMHLAETLAEREFIENLTGDFVSLLEEFGIWDPAAFQNRLSILGTLEILAQAPSALVVHGNYLKHDELDFIGSHRDRMSVAFCPRTHQFFGHSQYPLLEFLARKINVCVGTDSRASNPNLDLFNELRLVAASFPELDPLTILEMGTLNGAHALGMKNRFGSIAVGKSAALNLISNADADTRDWDWLFSESSTCQPIVTST